MKEQIQFIKNKLEEAKVKHDEAFHVASLKPHIDDAGNWIESGSMINYKKVKQSPFKVSKKSLKVQENYSKLNKWYNNNFENILKHHNFLWPDFKLADEMGIVFR